MVIRTCKELLLSLNKVSPNVHMQQHITAAWVLSHQFFHHSLAVHIVRMSCMLARASLAKSEWL